MEQYHTKVTRQQHVTWILELFVLIEDKMACFNENKHEQSIRNFESFNLLPKVLGMLTFCAAIVIHRSNYLSGSQITQSDLSQHSLMQVQVQTLIQWNKPLEAKWHILPQDRGKMVQFHFFVFLYLKKIIIHAYISWLNICIVIISRFLPNTIIIGWTVKVRPIFP